MYVFICPNPQCRQHGVERLFEYEAFLAELERGKAEADASGQAFDTQPHVACGICDTEMTDQGHEVADDYVPAPPLPEYTDGQEQQAEDLADAQREQQVREMLAALEVAWEQQRQGQNPDATYIDVARWNDA